jgi:S1-C subfamily serine protease
VATNYHVVKDSYDISARLVGREASYSCTVVGKDEENDLAILEVQGLRGYSLGLALTLGPGRTRNICIE